MALSFLQLAKKILQEENEPLTVTEMWKIAVDKEQDKLVESTGKTPWATLGARLYVDVRDNPDSIFMPIEGRPKRFILKSEKDKILVNLLETIIVKEPDQTKSTFFEKDLHPLMVYYGYYYLKAYLKTIKHNLSGKKNFGEWVHPDIVGCYYPFLDWDQDVVEVSNLLGNSAIKLYSFEIKRKLSTGNLRESFFQAVSNSSWGNEGYLAAADIDKDDDFLNELKRLSSSFGIGVIELNIEDPDSSQIIFPAKTKDIIDWDTVNKMANMNPDFKNFLTRIKIDMNSREARKEMYDAILEKENLIKLCCRK